MWMKKNCRNLLTIFFFLVQISSSVYRNVHMVYQSIKKRFMKVMRHPITTQTNVMLCKKKTSVRSDILDCHRVLS